MIELIAGDAKHGPQMVKKWQYAIQTLDELLCRERAAAGSGL